VGVSRGAVRGAARLARAHARPATGTAELLIIYTPNKFFSYFEFVSVMIG
jgi:hypothetical protein